MGYLVLNNHICLKANTDKNSPQAQRLRAECFLSRILGFAMIMVVIMVKSVAMDNSFGMFRYLDFSKLIHVLY